MFSSSFINALKTEWSWKKMECKFGNRNRIGNLNVYETTTNIINPPTIHFLWIESKSIVEIGNWNVFSVASSASSPFAEFASI